MVNILARIMEWSPERFASIGQATLADGTFTLVSVTVAHSTCTIWEGHQAVPSVTVETKDIILAWHATHAKMEQLVNPMAMDLAVSVRHTSKE